MFWHGGRARCQSPCIENRLLKICNLLPDAYFGLSAAGTLVLALAAALVDGVIGNAFVLINNVLLPDVAAGGATGPAFGAVAAAPVVRSVFPTCCMVLSRLDPWCLTS